MLIFKDITYSFVFRIARELCAALKYISDYGVVLREVNYYSSGGALIGYLASMLHNFVNKSTGVKIDICQGISSTGIFAISNHRFSSHSNMSLFPGTMPTTKWSRLRFFGKFFENCQLKTLKFFKSVF